MTRDSGVPAAVPAAWTRGPLSPNDSAPSGQLRAGNTSATSGVRGSSQPRLGRLELNQLKDSLSDRDLNVLRSVASHRFVTTRHIDRLHFAGLAGDGWGTRMCRRVLKRLHEQRVLTHLDQRVGGVRAGSASYVWQVGPVGDRLLRLDTGRRIRARQHEPSQWLLKHCLAIADAHVALVHAARSERFDLLDVATEPSCWRRFMGIAGEPRVLKPDLAVVTASGSYEDHWFVEIDLGHEHLPTILDKCRMYEAYRSSGIEEEQRGVFPLVAWVMHTDERATKLREALSSTRQLDSDLFRVTTAEHLIDLITGGSA
jgi:hypothetical protein